MLDKKTFIHGLNKLLVAYPNWKLDIDSDFTLRVWYEKFKHMDGARFKHMIDQYVENEERIPTIAGLKRCDTFPRKSIDQIKHEEMLREEGLI